MKQLNQEQNNYLNNCFHQIKLSINKFIEDKKNQENNNEAFIMKENNFNEDFSQNNNLEKNKENKTILNNFEEKDSDKKNVKSNNQSFDNINEETSEKTIKKEFNLLSYLNEEDYENENSKK